MIKEIEYGGRKGMVERKMYYKIQELKSMGYSDRRVSRELDIDRETVKKYRTMDEEAYIK